MKYVWTQWSDLKIPKGLAHLPTDGFVPSRNDLAKISFFVPRYMGGTKAIEMIPQMVSLEVVQSPNAGFDDILPLLPLGVTLCNAAGVHDASTAELAVGLTIATRRGFSEFARNQAKGIWLHARNSALVDSKVGIVGFGNIGKLIVKQLEQLGVETLIFTRSGKLGTYTMEDFDKLLNMLDVVILILPLTHETRHLMNAYRLALLKEGGTLINVARGAIVDTDALVIELQSGRINAGIDVTDPEPLPSGHPLWTAPNVIITPHVGGDTAAFEPRCRTLVGGQLERFALGLPLVNVVV